MKSLEKDLLTGRHLETAIPEFAGRMFRNYRNYACARLSMNYFTYYEMVGEETCRDKRLSEYSDRFHNIINVLISDETSCFSDAIDQTERLRNQVIEVMNGLTAWVDIFNLYEYCLNRIEYKFEDGSEFLAHSDEELIRDLLRYLLEDKDHVVVNTKISEIVRQLPVRMTKSHFFELLKEGLSVYKDSEIRGIDDFIYRIRTTAMLEIPPVTFELSAAITEIFHEFEHADFSSLTKEDYKKLRDSLQICVEKIQTAVDRYMLLAENINDAYVLLLTSPDFYQQSYSYIAKPEKDPDTEAGMNLIMLENRLFSGESYEESYPEIEDGFFYLEGKQEKYGEQIQKYGYVMEEAMKSHEELWKEKQYHLLVPYFERLEKLVSGSVFAELGQQESEAGEISTEVYLNRKWTLLTEELSSFFETHPKLMNRAVMAHVLSELPVFFHNLDELKDYISRSLSGCGNPAEKAAVVQIFTQMMNES